MLLNFHLFFVRWWLKRYIYNTSHYMFLCSCRILSNYYHLSPQECLCECVWVCANVRKWLRVCVMSVFVRDRALGVYFVLLQLNRWVYACMWVNNCVSERICVYMCMLTWFGHAPCLLLCNRDRTYRMEPHVWTSNSQSLPQSPENR